MIIDAFHSLAGLHEPLLPGASGLEYRGVCQQSGGVVGLPATLLAEREASALLARISRSGFVDFDGECVLPVSALEGEGGGKMLGVLVCRRGSELGVVRAFSGQLERSFEVPGWAPCATENVLDALEERQCYSEIEELSWRVEQAREPGGTLATLEERYAMIRGQNQQRLALLREDSRQARELRHARRALLVGRADPEALDELAQLDADSQRHKAQDRATRQACAEQLRVAEEACERERGALRQLRGLRADKSRALMGKIHAATFLTNFAGHRNSLVDAFAGVGIPTGTAECCAPKLLQTAVRQQLEPLSMVEVWWGAEGSSSGREHGQFYPACEDKCGPLMDFLLTGLSVGVL